MSARKSMKQYSLFKRDGLQAWLDLFNSRGIVYETHHKNCKKGNAVIDCPFCPSSLASGKFHMGVDPYGRYGCWRDDAHRGSNPAILIAKLFNISIQQAQELVGGDAPVDEEAWDQTLSKIKEWQKTDSLFDDDDEIQDEDIVPLELPSCFHPIKPFGDSQDFFDYIISRGFPRRDVRKLIQHFDLHYCLSKSRVKGNSWAWRIITPVRLNGKIMTWGSRTIVPNSDLRYMSLRASESVEPVKNLVYNFDACYSTGGRVLLLTEGQVDTWKLDFYGKSRGIRSAALFSKSIVDSQVTLLELLKEKFDYTFILLDANEEAAGMRLCDKINSGGKVVKSLVWSSNDEDAGAATPQQLCKFFDELLAKCGY